MYLYPDAVLVIFSKAPIPGLVKTRLIPSLSALEAAQIHCELTERTVQIAIQNRLCTVQLWCSPTFDHPFFLTMSEKYNISLIKQVGKDLGDRMHHAFAKTLQQYRHSVLIGCDCPSLSSKDIEEALKQLKAGKNCVLGPAEDGGYVLIGLNQPQPILFENMPWGSNSILQLTSAKLCALNQTVHELSTQWDVDNEVDLIRYQNQCK